jgi:hypothetical protein
MAVKSSSRYSHVKRASRYEYAQAWSNQRKRLAQAALADNQHLANSLVTVASNLISGSADLATQAAVKRITEATKKKFEQFDKLEAASKSIDISA